MYIIIRHVSVKSTDRSGIIWVFAFFFRIPKSIYSNHVELSPKNDSETTITKLTFGCPRRSPSRVRGDTG